MSTIYRGHAWFWTPPAHLRSSASMQVPRQSGTVNITQLFLNYLKCLQEINIHGDIFVVLSLVSLSALHRSHQTDLRSHLEAFKYFYLFYNKLNCHLLVGRRTVFNYMMHCCCPRLAKGCFLLIFKKRDKRKIFVTKNVDA